MGLPNNILGLNNRYLTFYLENEKYGIDISSVKEIIALMKTTRIPKTPPYLRGVMNLRGNIIPVVDMRLRFSLPHQEPQMQTAIIITQVHGINIGFIVDKVEEVLSSKEEQVSQTPNFGLKVSTEFIKCMLRVNEDVIMILNLEILFTQQELDSMNMYSQQDLLT